MSDDHFRASDRFIVELKDKIDQIYEILIGKGDAPGLVVRMDRLEQSEMYRKAKLERSWQGRLAIWSVLGSLLVERVIHYLRQ